MEYDMERSFIKQISNMEGKVLHIKCNGWEYVGENSVKLTFDIIELGRSGS